MRLEILVIMLMLPLIYGAENSTTTTTAAPTTISSSSSSVISSSSVPASSSTSAPTTSIAPNTTNSTKPVKLPSGRTTFLNTTNLACNCDTTLNCDVNCCCDIDCSEGILQAFRCDDGMHIEDYHHGEGLERCEVDDGLFCIISDNLGSPNYYFKAPSHAEYSAYRWPKISSLNGLEPRREIGHDFYKFGDAIITLDTKTEKVGNIKIPATLTDSSTCFLAEPIKFLNTKTVKCLRSLNELCSYNAKLLLQLVDSQLFRRPSKMSETREAADVFNINLRTCRHTLINCTEITAEETDLMGDEVFDEVRMEFVINDTSIYSVTVTFLSHDELVCGTDELGPTKIIQTVDVSFKNLNENRDRHVRKHSRGYSVDELILASRLRPVNESVTDGEMVLDYFRNETSADIDFHLKLPEVRDGICVLDDDVHDLVCFNENSQTICSVELVRDEKLNETACQQFQRQIARHLFNTLNLTSNYTQDGFASDIYVSKFWSPSYNVASWARVDVHNIPAWSPEMREIEKAVICSGIATSATYSFYSSRVRSIGSRKYLNVIEGLKVEFGQVDEINFPLDTENRTATVELLIQVQFFNLNEKIQQSGAQIFFGSLLLILFCRFFLSFV